MQLGTTHKIILYKRTETLITCVYHFILLYEIVILSFTYSSNLALVSLNVSNIHFLVFLNFKFSPLSYISINVI